MPYATRAAIEQLYGAEALALVADRGTPAATTAAIEAALARASDEIDLHVAAAYALPLAATPPQLTQLCVDVALYRLALDAGVRTDEHRQRYDDAVALLKRIAEGKAKLTLPPGAPEPPVDPEDPFAGQGPRPIVIAGPERVWTRETLRDLP